ncbi:L-galactose dehydrogenase [Seminavis robusta]|uniref:L-galactose dehydrogenase n=1 Tax=Seminavis robusta TaxID=568900 RepID=A0A9N8H0L3_9STRA|nr:L-galactose dehydrogenase [Seminavis robusta]|eukprot:Sro3_g002770.1 L-galactose dehydrogenase (350) ;mRNA; r:239084-240221
MTTPIATLRQLGWNKNKLLRPCDIVLGGIWLGPGSGSHGNGNHPDPWQENSNALIRAAVEAGIEDFDTAPWYGAGAAEERMGRAIKALAADADSKLRIGTKAGRIFFEPPISGNNRALVPALAGFDQPTRPPLSARICRNDYTAQGARRSLEHSLNRLGLQGVHTLRIHDPNDNSNNNRQQSTESSFVDEVEQALATPDGMIAELRAMRDEQGIIRHVGLGMNTNREGHMGAPDQVLRLLHGTPRGTFDSALLAGGWNLLCRTGWECLETCHTLGVQVHVAGIFASGYLADDNKSYAYKEDTTPASHLVALKHQWATLAKEYGCSLASVAIGFATLPPAVTKLTRPTWA